MMRNEKESKRNEVRKEKRKDQMEVGKREVKKRQSYRQR